MMVDIVIPSKGNISKLNDLLNSINLQSFQPDKVHVLLDKEFSKDDFDVLKYFLLKNINESLQNKIYFYSNINSDLLVGQGVSYLRNYGIRKSKSKFIYLIDDDNIFGEEFLENTVRERLYLNEQENKDFVLSPTILYRKTKKVQSQGIKYFNFWLSKVKGNILSSSYGKVEMIGSNSLFGKKELLDKYPYDEDFKFVYEDLDFSYRIHKAGYPIVVTNNIFINHMERNKTILEKSFIGDYSSAFQKSKNRIKLVKKNAERNDKLKFFFVGLWIQTIWFLILILFFSSNRVELIKAVIKGTYVGFINRC